MDHKRSIHRQGLLLLMLFLATACKAQAQGMLTPFEEWTTQEGTQNIFYESKTVTDGSGNVYKTGATLNGNGDYDIITVKYNRSGVQQWIAQYAGAGGGDDAGAKLAVDGSGNVFVTGSYYANSADSNNCILIKYNSSGTQQWTATYDGGQGRGDAGADLAIDASLGDIYICGTTYTGATNEYDFLALKYNSSGTQQWVRTWDNLDMWDGAHKISFRNGKATISGGTQINATRYDYVTIQYTSAGAFGSAAFAGGSNPIGFNRITGMVTDASGNIYITGTAGDASYNYYTIKLDANLSQLWTATYNGPDNLDDVANDIQVDASGNVYVTGYSRTYAQGRNYVTIKYNSSGTQQWASSYNSPDNGDDEAYALSLDSNGGIYVTGSSFTGITDDCLTIKYDNSGNELWTIGFNSWTNGNDRATDIVIDSSGDIIVAGQSEKSGTYEYNTVRYVEKSTILPPDTVPLGSLAFIENRGQVLDADSLTSNVAVQYYSVENSPALFFTDEMLSLVSARIDFDTATVDSMHRVDMTWVGRNTGKVRPMNEADEYANFFLSQLPAGGRPKVPMYKRLVTHDLYNNIDLVCFSNVSGFKHDYIIKPGASPSSIVVRYMGTTSLSVNGSGQLLIGTSLGTLPFARPVAYQVDSAGNYESLPWQPTYSVAGTQVTFSNIGTYDTTLTLVIQIDQGNVMTPAASMLNVMYSSVMGGDYNTAFFSVTTSATGKVFLAGQSQSTCFPTTGAFQAFRAGNLGIPTDLVAARFSNIGAREWATYYGNEVDQYNGKGDVDANGNFYMQGYTVTEVMGGPLPMPPVHPPAAYVDTTFNGGGTDAFYLALDSTGQNLLWATYYGGSSGSEFPHTIKVDGSGNVYAALAGDTLTPRKFRAGAYNDSTSTAGVLVKFSSGTFAHDWATYYPAAPYDIDFDPAGVQYVIGRVSSTALPIVNPMNGAYVDSTYNGNTDMFITKFDTAHAISWSTYLGGASADYGSRILPAPSGSVYFGGESASSDFPVFSSGAYIDSVYTGGTDVILGKISKEVIVWSSFYGGSAAENLSGLAVDTAGSVYFCGSARLGATVFPVTTSVDNSAWYHAANAGSGTNNDAYILAFDESEQRFWATHFGYAGDDFGADVAAWESSKLFMAGTTNQSGTGVPYNQQYPSTIWWSWSYSQSVDPTPPFNPIGQQGHITWFDISSPVITAVDEVALSEGGNILVYPNPGSGVFNILLNLEEDNALVSVEVYNISGQLIYGEEYKAGKDQLRTIDLSGQSNGVYVLLFKGKAHSIARRIIKH